MFFYFFTKWYISDTINLTRSLFYFSFLGIWFRSLLQITLWCPSSVLPHVQRPPTSTKCLQHNIRLQLETDQSRGKLFTPQPTRRGHENKKMFESPLLGGKRFESPLMESKRIISLRVGINRYESPVLGGKKTIINQLQKDLSFSSPKSERGFVLRKDNIHPQIPARWNNQITPLHFKQLFQF